MDENSLEGFLRAAKKERDSIKEKFENIIKKIKEAENILKEKFNKDSVNDIFQAKSKPELNVTNIGLEGSEIESDFIDEKVQPKRNFKFPPSPISEKKVESSIDAKKHFKINKSSMKAQEPSSIIKTSILDNHRKGGNKKSQGTQATIRHRTRSGIEVGKGEKFKEKKRLLNFQNKRKFIRQKNHLSSSDFYTTEEIQRAKSIVRNIKESNKKKMRKRPFSTQSFTLNLKNSERFVQSMNYSPQKFRTLGDSRIEKYDNFGYSGDRGRVLVVEHHHLHHLVGFDERKRHSSGRRKNDYTKRSRSKW